MPGANKCMVAPEFLHLYQLTVDIIANAYKCEQVMAHTDIDPLEVLRQTRPSRSGTGYIYFTGPKPLSAVKRVLGTSSQTMDAAESPGAHEMPVSLLDAVDVAPRLWTHLNKFASTNHVTFGKGKQLSIPMHRACAGT
eukprot:scaffold1629_cov369-Prasinococcus_capsulatus_cf.AAC.23